MYFWGSSIKNFFYEGAILKMRFLKEQFWKCIFSGSNFGNVFFKEYFFKGSVSKIYLKKKIKWKLEKKTMKKKYWGKAFKHILKNFWKIFRK